MLANLPVEIILFICEYPESKDLGQLAWTNRRMMQIIKKYLPTALDRRILFYRPDPPEWREWASVAYFKDKLYYLGGLDFKTDERTKRVDEAVYLHTDHSNQSFSRPNAFSPKTSQNIVE
ncbi:hypothetical protein WR25_14063 [Diploscapter pachys]|uniref:F-box domain-containing protein n=1 Tax=Diploscapter pachys TaxID=2018661 RepID=A0A2A2J5S8_9BILA|nr:hypothetical protein WR25_14063 [Diploscapter pachys]